MSLMTILIIILILALVGGLPNVSGHGYGWAPSGLLGTVLIVILILVLLGRL